MFTSTIATDLVSFTVASLMKRILIKPNSILTSTENLVLAPQKLAWERWPQRQQKKGKEGGGRRGLSVAVWTEAAMVQGLLGNAVCWHMGICAHSSWGGEVRCNVSDLLY